MKLGEFYDYRFNPYDIQFCLSIQICNEGYAKVARKLLTYATLMGHGVVGGEVNSPEVLQAVNEERNYINRSIMELASITNESLDFTTVRWFFETPILKAKESSYRTNQTLVSVKSLIGGTEDTLQRLYAMVMKMLYEVPPNYLIVHYIKSSMFWQPFKTAINYAIKNKFSYRQVRNLTEEDYKVLLDDFYKNYRASITPHSEIYRTITGDPDSSLCGKPVKVYYFDRAGTKIQSVLFGSGQELEVGDSSVSKLNLIELDDGSSVDEIPFAEICTRINRASKLLFQHLNAPVVYDIFSHHCDARLGKIIEDFSANCYTEYRGNPISIKSDSIAPFSNETHRGKIKDRIKYADYLNDRFARSVSINDLEDIQNKLLEITRDMDYADGHRLFNAEDHVVSLNYTEGERIEILTSGYKAMYDLIRYIEANEGRTGVSINDFPTAIFRDAAYLNRFKSFDEYINGYSVIDQMLHEISTNNNRFGVLFDGFREGSSVQSILAAQDSIKYIAELQALGKRHISCIYKYAHVSRSTNSADAMAKVVDDLANEFYLEQPFASGYPGIEHKREPNAELFDTFDAAKLYNLFRSYVMSPSAGAFAQIKAISDPQNQDFDESLYHSKSAYILGVQMLTVFELMIEQCGVPLVDDASIFVITKEFLMNFGNTLHSKIEELIPSVDQAQLDGYEDALGATSKFFVFACVGITYCYNVFFGKSEGIQFASNLADDDIFKVFNCFNYLKAYLDKAYSICAQLSDFVYYTSGLIEQPAKRKSYEVSNAFQLMLNHTKDIPFMSIPKKVTDTDEIVCLFSLNKKAMLPASAACMTIEEQLEDSKESRKLLLDSLNHMLDAFQEQVQQLNQLSVYFKNKAAGSIHEEDYFDSDAMSAFVQVDNEILSDSFIYTEETAEIMQQLQELHLQKNKYNFFTKDGNMICRKTEIYTYYYHSYGYVCYCLKNGEMQRRLMTADDIKFLWSF